MGGDNGLSMSRYPVFIVGSPRSGTSILVDALLSVGYHGYREGMFLSMLHYVDGIIDRHYSIFGSAQNLISATNKSDLKRQLYEVFKTTTSDLNREAPWFDKTGNPDMILSIPILRQLWPDSVFIFAKRRAIENIVSRMKKFPGHSFEYHCGDWAKNMSAWRRIRTELPPSSFVEVDQQDMIRQPKAVASDLQSLLALSAEGAQKILKTFESNRPQQTSEGSATRVHSLSSSGFTDGQISTFLKHCKVEMDAFGYSIDENYRAMAPVAG